MLPKTFNRVVFRFVVIFCALAAAYGYARENLLSFQFDEGRASTFLSCSLLLASAFFAGRTFLERRRQTPWSGWRTPWVVWGLVAAGFVFLAADDAFRFHEKMDHAIHKIFHLHETGLSDRLDDLIIVLYAVAGLGVLCVYWREMWATRGILPYLVWGVVYTFVQSGFDALGNRDDVLTWLFQEPGLVHRLEDLTETAEGVTEALAEGYLLAAFYTASFLVRHRTGGDDPARPAATTTIRQD